MKSLLAALAYACDNNYTSIRLGTRAILRARAREAHCGMS